VRALDHRTVGRESKHFAGEQTTRLGQPLINELFIGITYKNEWNGNHPSGDERYNQFLLNPVVPLYVQLRYGAYGVLAPPFSRVDLLTVLHQGVPGLTQTFPADDEDDHDFEKSSDDDDDDDDSNRSKTPPVFADMLRMNVSVALYKNCSQQNPLGLVGGDTSGYPNGRRLGDDIVDISLRVAMGVLCAAYGNAFCGQPDPFNSSYLGSFQIKYTDQAPTRACMFKCLEHAQTTGDFPFLNPPIPGNQLFNPKSAFYKSQWHANCKHKTGNEAFVL